MKVTIEDCDQGWLVKYTIVDHGLRSNRQRHFVIWRLMLKFLEDLFQGRVV